MSSLGEQLRIRAFQAVGDPLSAEEGFRDWLTCGVFKPDLPSDTSSILLRNVPIREVPRYLGYDYTRFALACFESHFLARHERQTTRSYGWPLLKFYYSAFFGAHALMRSQGSGVSQLSGLQLRTFNTIIQIHHPNAPPFAGGTVRFRTLRIPGRHDEIDVQVSTVSKGNGVHDSFWREFCEFLAQQAEVAVQHGEADSALFTAASTELRDAILDGQTSWLSMVRNAINYHHDYDVWQPTKRSAESTKVMATCPAGNAA